MLPPIEAPTNTPPQVKARPWAQIWIDAIASPSEQTYITIANSALASRSPLQIALFWTLIAALFTLPLTIIQVTSPQVMSAATGTSSPLISPEAQARYAVAIFIATLVLYVPFFITMTFIGHGLARMFNGFGTFGVFAYVMASFATPLRLVITLLSLLALALVNVGTLGTILGGLSGLVSFGLLIYSLALEAVAVKVVYRFPGWGAPAVVVALRVLLAGLAAFTIIMLLAVVILLPEMDMLAFMETP